VVVEAAGRAEHLRDRLAEEAEVVLLQPLVVEPAGELHRQLDGVVVGLQGDGAEGLEPRPKALAADVVSDEGETLVPDRFGRVVHGGARGGRGTGGGWVEASGRRTAPKPRAHAHRPVRYPVSCTTLSTSARQGRRQREATAHAAPSPSP